MWNKVETHIAAAWNFTSGIVLADTSTRIGWIRIGFPDSERDRVFGSKAVVKQTLTIDPNMDCSIQ